MLLLEQLALQEQIMGLKEHLQLLLMLKSYFLVEKTIIKFLLTLDIQKTLHLVGVFWETFLFTPKQKQLMKFQLVQLQLM